jgi:phospholipid/cholesterol/gamma-HCH transport system substrate-binding protein
LFDYKKAEIAAGAFLLAGLAALAYLSLSIGGLRLRARDSYRLRARFSNVGDLKVRAPVKLAGVTIGSVETIRLVDYYAEVELAVDRTVPLPADTIASIATAGLLGEAHVSLSPGAADRNLAAGERIARTEPALNVADLLGRYAFGNANGSPPAGAPESGPPASNQRPAPATAPTREQP